MSVIQASLRRGGVIYSNIYHWIKTKKKSFIISHIYCKENYCVDNIAYIPIDINRWL